MGSLHVSTGVGTELLELLNKNPRFEFKIEKIRHPNGWGISSRLRKRRWWDIPSHFYRFAGIMCPPYEIETDVAMMAGEMHIVLQFSDFNVKWRR